MVLNDIETLVKKYENGETTQDEELQLKSYFSSDNVASHLEVYKPMFVYFLNSQKEAFTKEISLRTNKKKNYKWISIAAIAIVMLSVYFGKSDDLGTYNEPEEAFNEVSRTLTMISTHLNTGVSTVGYLSEMNKGRATLNYLNEIENATRLIFKNNQ